MKWVTCGSLAKYRVAGRRFTFLCGLLPDIRNYTETFNVCRQSIFEQSNKDSGEIQCDGFGGREDSRWLFSLLGGIFFCMREVCEAS